MTCEVYLKEDGCGWISIKGFAICVQTTDEGVVVDIYDEAVLDEGRADDALMASTYAFDNDLEVANGDTD